MSDPFSSARRRIARAKKHITHIKTRMRKFLKPKPYTGVVEPDGETGYNVHKVKLLKPIPEIITDLAYEAIEALRSSLDHAVYAIADACGSKRPDLVHFPIADTPSDFENILKGRIKDFPPEILDIFRGCKPYKGENDLVWALNRIRRQSTHRLVVPVGMASSGMRIEHMRISGGAQIFAPRWDAENNEIILFRTENDAEFDYNINVAFFVAFGEVEGVAGSNVPETLRLMADEVTRIVTEIKAIARNIGLIT